MYFRRRVNSHGGGLSVQHLTCTCETQYLLQVLPHCKFALSLFETQRSLASTGRPVQNRPGMSLQESGALERLGILLQGIPIVHSETSHSGEAGLASNAQEYEESTCLKVREWDDPNTSYIEQVVASVACDFRG